MAEVESLISLDAFISEDGITNRAEFEAKLRFLVDVTRSGDGRQELAVAKAVPRLLSFSSSIFPCRPEDLQTSRWSSGTFNLYVKLLRNLCAGNRANQEALVGFGGLEVIASVVQVLGHGGCAPDDDVVVAGDSPAEASMQNAAIEGLQMMLQLLGNVAGLGEWSQGRIWERFFPSIFEIVARVSSEKTQGPLCMLIFTCCRDNETRCTELSQGKGPSIVALLLNRGAAGRVSSNDVAPNEWLEFLITRLCFAKPCFRLLFTELGGIGRTITETNGLSQMAARISFTKEQASLLDVLNASLSAREEEKHSDDPSSVHYTSMPSTSASFLIDIIKSAAKYAASTGLSALKLPTNSPAADILGLSLSMTRILCVLDEKRSNILPKFASSGLIPLMLDLLRALGPPDSAKATPTLDGDQSNSSSELNNCTSIAEKSTKFMGRPRDDDPSSTKMDLDEQSSSSSLNDHENIFPRRDVYIGYRRDVVAVIANASHRCFSIQEAVRENGGLLLVLQQCMLDNNNPFLREWGLWAIRNLLEGNSRNQSELADLEIRSAVPDSRLRDAGMSVEINPETGRPRLVNVTPASAVNPAVDESI